MAHYEAFVGLIDAARQFSTEADYTVAASTEEAFVEALEEAEAALDQLRGAVDRIAVLELALRDVTDDGWADGESAMRGYIERAEGAITRAHARGR